MGVMARSPVIAPRTGTANSQARIGMDMTWSLSTRRGELGAEVFVERKVVGEGGYFGADAGEMREI